MPFRSIAQRNYLFAKHPKVAKQFQAETPPGMSLPNRVKPKGKSKPKFRKKSHREFMPK